ncbi:mannosyl-oligosaccharide glucosidase, partial [Trypanosoma conorhini]
MQMRDRRPLLAGDAANRERALASTPKKEARPQLQEEPPQDGPLKTSLTWILFFLVILGGPLGIIYYFTPFFVVENLGCRVVDRLWGDDVARAMEAGYQHYRDAPPRFPSLEYNKTMLWGTYEPGLLFAMKTRTPRPVYVGLAWYDEAGLHPVRHRVADVLSLERRRGGRDGVISDEKTDDFEALWALHDGVYYGRLYVQDGPAKLQVEFLKSPSGDSWHVRTHGQLDGAEPVEFLVYVVNGGGDALEPEPTPADTSWDAQIKSEFEDAEGRREGFSLRIHDDNNPVFAATPWRVDGWTSAEDDFLRDVNFRSLPPGAQTYKTGPAGVEGPQPRRDGVAPHNVMLFRKRYASDFRVELSMRHALHLGAGGQDATERRPFTAASEALTTCQLTNAFRSREKQVLLQMRQMFTPWRAGSHLSLKLFINRARRLLSGALGAWGFWYGRYLYVDPGVAAALEAQGKATTVQSDDQLRTTASDVSAFGAVASRLGSSYGDMTLTGYHLLFLMRWNREWTKEAIASWLVGAQDANSGFIPHLATFTAAARASAPPSARYESLTSAAPPTLLLTLSQLLRSDEAAASEKEFFELLLPPLRRWRSWFHETQSSEDGALSLEALVAAAAEHGAVNSTPPRYRWRPRDGDRLPSSGMPDYPRPACPGQHGREAHVDLFSWVALLSSIVSDVELRLGLAETVPRRLWPGWLDAVHWDARRQRYADRGGCPADSFSPYAGYANLYPLLLGIIDDKARALRVVELASSELMTQYGMMSVS